MIEHRRVRGEQHRMLLRQIGGAGTKLDGFGIADQRRQKQQAVGDVLRLLGQMLANECVVKTQLVGENDGLAVFLQGLGAIASQRMQGHGEIA